MVQSLLWRMLSKPVKFASIVQPKFVSVAQSLL